MNYILSVSFANQAVAKLCYEHLASQLQRTAFGFPCEVIVFDNKYPLNDPKFLPNLCAELGFMYQTVNQNVGLYMAYNILISRLPKDTQTAIFFDGDNLVDTPDWYIACSQVVQEPDVVHCMVANHINQRELSERGYTSEVIADHNVKVSQECICATVGAFNIPWLRSIGGTTSPNYYYGGNEIEMWRHYAGKKLCVLDDYWEDLDTPKGLQDWQYEEYKLLYAHKGMRMSFDQYVATSPKQLGREKLLKEIFG